MPTTPYTLRLFQDRKKDWRWSLIARNGKIVATSGEGYRRRIDCDTIAMKLLKGECYSAGTRVRIEDNPGPATLAIRCTCGTACPVHESSRR